MKLREIKMQALRLMHADVQIVHDAEVAGLEWDANYGPLYAGMPAAINRCLADIEARQILPPRRVLLENGEVRGSRCRFSLGGIADFSEVARIAFEKGDVLIEDHPFVYEEEGVIRVDGTDIRQFTLQSLRRQIGMVQQDVHLFSGTVLSNIEYGRPGASREGFSFYLCPLSLKSITKKLYNING